MSYTQAEIQKVKNLFQSLCVTGSITIKEIVDGIATANLSKYAEFQLASMINTQIRSYPFACAADNASRDPSPDSILTKMMRYAVAEIPEILSAKEIDSCLRHCIDYSNILMGYEREQAEERAGWQSKIDCDNRERALDAGRDHFTKTWSLFV
jgi:hypothetical protein